MIASLSGKQPKGVKDRRAVNVRNKDVASVIIIGAPEPVLALLHARCGHVIAFSSLAELDGWRAARGAEETFGADVAAALDEIGCPMTTLPGKLRRQLEDLATQTRIPTLSALTREWPSRRSFYRVWGESINETPSVLLRRLRALHAKRLMAMGRSKKEAAYLAGFSSVDQMRRTIQK